MRMNQNERLHRLVALWQSAASTAWAPLVAKALGACFILGLLALLGSGLGDRFFAAAPAQAKAEARATATSHSASAVSTSMEAIVASASPAAPNASARTSANSPTSAPPSALLPDGRLVLNLADVEQLDRLPGVGRKKAEAIVALRAKLGGRFRKLEELARVRGIKRRFIERIRPLVVLDAPSTSEQSASSPP